MQNQPRLMKNTTVVSDATLLECTLQQCSAAGRTQDRPTLRKSVVVIVDHTLTNAILSETHGSACSRCTW